MHAWISAYVQAQLHAAAATSLPAVLDGPGGVGEPVPGVSGSVGTIPRGQNSLLML